MKKYVPLILVALFGCVAVESFKQRFRILPNKKISSNLEYHKNFNIFKCINKCRKESDCKIFNYNSRRRICQLTDQKIDEDHQEVTENCDWKVYIPIINQVNCQKVFKYLLVANIWKGIFTYIRYTGVTAWKVSKYGVFLVRIQKNTYQKKLRIWTLFTQWVYIQLHAKFMKQCQEIKQNWTGRETLISVFLQFLTISINFFCGRETGY